MTLRDVIAAASDQTLAAAIVNSYVELETNHFTRAWKTSELDAGHFVEAVRRFIEFKLFSAYPPIGRTLSAFNEAAFKKYENASGDEAYRIHIPRVLFAIYGIRNKRGVGHLSLIKPGKIDASLILHSAKWVLAEIVRLNSTQSAQETERLLDDIIERKLDAVWEINGTSRIIIDGLTIDEKVLLLLLRRSPQTEGALLDATEYRNQSRFAAKLKELHDQRMLERSKGKCFISPKGRVAAENLLAGTKQLGQWN